MAKPVRSIRVPDALWSRVESYARNNHLKTNGAVEALLALGLERNTQPAMTHGEYAEKIAKPQMARVALQQAEAKAAHLAKPPVASRRSWSLKGVPLGPVPRPPGSMLIDKHPGKKRR